MENPAANSYLSQLEASALAGVSAATLMRFAEAGYFRVIERNGQRQFSRQEIFEVFGPAIAPAIKSALAKNEEASSSNTALRESIDAEVDNYEGHVDSGRVDSGHVHSGHVRSGHVRSGHVRSGYAEAGPAEKIDSSVIGSKADDLEDRASIDGIEDQKSSTFDNTADEVTDQNDFLTSDSFSIDNHSVSTQSNFENTSPLAHKVEKIINDLEPSENTRAETINAIAFKQVLQLQEELLAQKENRINDLLKERDWLRNRLEKMEDKSDRDQMLLMVESQKVRTLINKEPTKKKNIVQLALDWIGGKQDTETNQPTKEG